MRPETPFDIDEIFHAADTPDMAVDIDAVVATGRRVRRRRRLAGAAGLTAATIVAAVTTASGVLGQGSADTSPAAPASSTAEPSQPSTTQSPAGTATITTVRRGDHVVGAGACAGPSGCHQPDFTVTDVRPGTYGLRCYADGSDVAFWERPDAVEVTSPSTWTYSPGGWCGATDAISTIKVALFGGPSGDVESGFHPW